MADQFKTDETNKEETTEQQSWENHQSITMKLDDNKSFGFLFPKDECSFYEIRLVLVELLKHVTLEEKKFADAEQKQEEDAH